MPRRLGIALPLLSNLYFSLYVVCHMLQFQKWRRPVYSKSCLFLLYHALYSRYINISQYKICLWFHYFAQRIMLSSPPPFHTMKDFSVTSSAAYKRFIYIFNIYSWTPAVTAQELVTKKRWYWKFFDYCLQQLVYKQLSISIAVLSKTNC